jgi:tRNA A37 threonylcarbamoyladenosine dehydratase
MSWLERTELLVQQEGLEKLKKANILVVGLGGVGSYAAEFIARAGVGKMTIVDGDVCIRLHYWEVKSAGFSRTIKRY